MQVLWIARSKTSKLPNQRKMTVPLDPCNITSLRSQWIAKMMWRCFQCQLPRMTGTSFIKSGEYVTAPSETAKLVDIGILDLNMFRKFLKNSNSMFDVALSMWLLFSMFKRNWQVIRQQERRSKKKHEASRPNRRQRLQKPLKLDSFEGANLDFSSMLL